MFIWRLANCEGGDLTNIIKRAKSAGLGHLVVKFVDGQTPYNSHPDLKALVALAHSQSVEVWGWPYTYGKQPEMEATVAAHWYREIGFDGFVIDAEGEYKNNTPKATTYAQTLRNALPDEPIGLSSYWCPSLHPEFPWEAFINRCDFIMPQVYWSPSKRDSGDCLERSMKEFAKWAKPIVPTGGVLDDANLTSDELTEFMEHAVGAGIRNFNLWHWAGAKPAHWTAIAQFPLGRTVSVQVIRHKDGAKIARFDMVEGGNHLADQGKIYVK